MANAGKLLVIEDDPAIRRLLAVTLERAGYRVILAASAREGLSAIDIDRPDAIMLDLGLPDRDGLELIQPIRARSAAPIIVVSARENTAEKVAALDLGADDYVVKPFDSEELLARVRTAFRHRGGEGDERLPLRIGPIEIDLLHRRVLRSAADIHLSPKEYEVLAELAKKPDRVITHGALLQTVWGPAHLDRVDYLRIVVRNLRQKLEDDPVRPALIRNEPGVGYRLKRS